MENIILNIIFILFPSLVYIIYASNKQNLKKDENKTVLDISYLFSLFLIIYYNLYFKNNMFIIYIFIVLLISSFNKRIIIYIIITIITYLLVNNSIYLFLIFIISSLLIYLFLNSKKIYNILSFINIFIFLIIYILLKHTLNLTTILYILLFILLSVFTSYIIKISENILNLKSIIQDFRKEKDLQSSLFKITHEIKNPLAVIKGYLSMIKIDEEKKEYKYLNIIKSETERSIRLLDDFKEFSKINLNKSNLDFTKLLYEIKDIISPLFLSKNIKFIFKTEENIFILGDEQRLKEVFVNLIKNSIDASYNNGKIELISYINKNKLNIIINDNGSGISQEDMKNIFTPFYTTKKDGTGLGIPLCKEIIEAHNGSINYLSKLKKGTTIKIIIPTY